MTEFETVQEDEVKLLSPLFLITDTCLGALMLYKLLELLRHESTVFSLPAEN